MPAPRPSSRLAALPLRVREAVGQAFAYSVLLAVLVPFYVVVALAGDLLVDHGESTGPVPWLHVVALPAEVGVYAGLMVLAVAFVGYLFVFGVRSIASALRRIGAGRWTDGTVRSSAGAETDIDGDTRFEWQVEFTDEVGTLHRTALATWDFSRWQVGVGTPVRVRYQVNDPVNAVVVRPGVLPRIHLWVTHGVLLVLWGFFVASIPVGLVVAGLLWLVRRA